MREKIAQSIILSDVETFRSISCEDIENFRDTNDDGANALLYAAMYASLETIKLIVDRMKEYFQSLINQSDVEKNSIEYGELRDSVEDRSGQFFYDQVEVKEVNYNAATFASIRGEVETKKYLFQVIGLSPGFIPDVDDLGDDEVLKVLGDVTTEQVPRFKRAGLASEPGGIIYSPPRSLASFAGQRTRQFLKHLSTMVFFNMPKTKELRVTKKGNTVAATLAEVEMMHFTYNGASFLFVAANEAALTGEFYSKFENLEVFKRKICAVPGGISQSDKEGMQRVNRYSKYINALIRDNQFYFDADGASEIEEDVEHLRQLKSLLESNETPFLFHTMAYKTVKVKEDSLGDDSVSFINETLSSNSAGAIIFLNTSLLSDKHRQRHAEEFLVDVAKAGKNYAQAQERDAYVIIGGKKRPCLSCHSRMESSSVVNEFGSRPGFLWTGRFKEQTQLNPEAARGVLSRAPQSVFVTINTQGNEESSYDSGTDCEL